MADVVQRRLLVKRRDTDDYRVVLEGCGKAVAVNSAQVGHFLGLVFGRDAAEPLEQALGELGQLAAEPLLHQTEADAAAFLLSAYREARM